MKNEKIPKFIVNYLIQQINLKKEIIKNVEHLNIILVVPSGVGKSTLINSILDLSIKTGFGCPQTKEIEFHYSNNIPFLRLVDINFSFSQQSLDILDEFIIGYFKEVLCIYQNNLENFLTKYSKKLASDISIHQIQFNTKNNNSLNNIFNNIDLELILRNELKEKLNKKVELAALKNSFQFIVEPLIEKIGGYFTELYKQGMNQKKFIEYATDIIKVSFDEIENKIKEYNEGLKEKKEKKIK